MRWGRHGPAVRGRVLVNHVVLLVSAVVGLSGWSAAQAQPLAFGTVNGADDFSKNPDVSQCRPASGQDGMRQCALKRSGFGGLPVSRTAMALNSDGKVRSLGIVLNGQDYDLAYQLLVGRYGPPATTRDFPRWIGFDGDANLSLRRSGPDAIVSFDFPANAAAASSQGTGIALTLLLFAGLGLVAGGIAYREYGAGRAKPARLPQTSMRDTLERRLREGRDLTF